MKRHLLNELPHMVLESNYQDSSRIKAHSRVDTSCHENLKMHFQWEVMNGPKKVVSTLRQEGLTLESFVIALH